jgi:hypothetical protein
MKAIYTCSTTTGKKVNIDADDRMTIEDIKSKAAETHGQVIVDVVNEQLLGEPDDSDDE